MLWHTVATYVIKVPLKSTCKLLFFPSPSLNYALSSSSEAKAIGADTTPISDAGWGDLEWRPVEGSI